MAKRRCKYEGCEGCDKEQCNGTATCKAYFKAGKKAYEITHVEERRESARIYREENGEHIKQLKKDWVEANREQYLSVKADWRKDNHLRNLVGSVLSNHKAMGYSVEVSIEDVMEMYVSTTHCKYCGVEMTHGNGKATKTSKSLDRTNNETVMRKDNIQVICRRCNTTKGDRSHADLIAYARKLLELNQ
jgi:5-methylcytosine-specific restriction endonuclease McrA